MRFFTQLKGQFTALMSKRLDDRSKRMIVLSTLFGHMCGDRSKIDIGIAHKLNKLLHLSNKDGALMFPIQLSHVLWKEDGLVTLELHRKEIDDDLELSQTTTVLTDNVPEWLRYDTVQAMREDFETLLRHKRQLAV